MNISQDFSIPEVLSIFTAPLGRLAKQELVRFPLLAADVDACVGVDDMAAVAGKFFVDVSAFFQPGHAKAEAKPLAEVL